MIRLRLTHNTAMVYHLHRAIFGDTAPWERADAHWIMEDTSLEASREIGFCSAIYYPHTWTTTGRSGAFLHRAGILPSHEGMGLQRRMVRVREAWARSQGCEVAVTYTSKDNAPSMANLLKEGYKFWPCWEGYEEREWQFFHKCLSKELSA